MYQKNIDEVFFDKRKGWLKCIKAKKGCKGCIGSSEFDSCDMHNYLCSARDREDKKDVIFIKNKHEAN